VAKITKELKFGDHTLVLETGEVARQADASVMVSMAGTVVLVTVVSKKESGENNSFFPLTVNYQERFYAAGKIPGGFLKREGRPGDGETLTSRLIDRPIRPLFPEGYKQEIQVVATVMSLNPDVTPDILALIGASCALSLSGLPFNGPIGAARVGYKDGIYLLNPSPTELTSSSLDLVVAGTEKAILMVESEAKELSEEVMLGAVLFGHESMKSVIAAINEMTSESGVQKQTFEAPAIDEVLVSKIEETTKASLGDAYLIFDKGERYAALKTLRNDFVASLQEENEDWEERQIKACMSTLESDIVRKRILAGEPRIGGRDRETVRPISIRTGILPRSHGSVLFTRGETQAIVAATLGNERDSKINDVIAGESRDRFMLHYNFPGYCVGEVSMMFGPKRREIGHGNLAKRALKAVLPDEKDCPYVLRVVSEITESNGSSSMASVCGASLSLMDAGVKIKAPVAGVAMGLIKEGDNYAVLTDILGDEDHLGDMDFKVAGTKEGVTALQMDIKIDGITKDIMEEALEQALKGRLHILDVMDNTLSAPREEMSAYAPQHSQMKINPDKIRNVIGKGGATIKAITEKTGVSIDIDDNGTVSIFSPSCEAMEAAKAEIKTVIADLEIGTTYTGKVIKLVDFGAFINLLPGKDGLLHISQICKARSQKVNEFLNEGDEVSVHVADIDKQGRVKLVWKRTPEQQAAYDASEVAEDNKPKEKQAEGEDQKS
jgi:polyribonucleotide nucleotidyltransferase